MSQPPGPPPPGYGYGPPPGPPPSPGRALPLIVGTVLGGVDLGVTALLGIGFIGATDADWTFFLGPVVGLLIPVLLLFRTNTRWWGVGMLIGFFLALIVIGGACAAILVSINNSYG